MVVFNSYEYEYCITRQNKNNCQHMYDKNVLQYEEAAQISKYNIISSCSLIIELHYVYFVV